MEENAKKNLNLIIIVDKKYLIQMNLILIYTYLYLSSD